MAREIADLGKIEHFGLDVWKLEVGALDGMGCMDLAHTSFAALKWMCLMVSLDQVWRASRGLGRNGADEGGN